MNDCTPLHRLRCLAVWVAVTGFGLGLVALLAGDLRLRPGAGFDEIVVTVAAWALCSAVAWASAVTTVVALEAARSTTPAPTPAGRGIPAPVRRLVLRACGAALAGSLAAGVAAPALATGSSLGATSASTGQGRSGETRTVLPAPPAGPVAPGRAHASPVPTSGPPAAAGPSVAAGPAVPAAVDAERVTTVPGDSLWRVAEAELRATTGRRPSDAEVAAYWPRIHATNRVLLGPDPDFVLPGVPLVLPATRTPDQTEEQP